ncbi:MAG: hypothetical protein NO516_03725 [Candidatus Methanomethylicia archaeon]|nr:hypothetical protein [Candidatus Methanomethylicia archaeon]
MVDILSLGLLGIIAGFVALLIIWVIVSLPVYLIAKIITGGRATLGQAMGATLLGPIVYVVVSFFAAALLSLLGGLPAAALAALIAFVAWLWLYKSIFRTGWAQALLIAILASILFIAIGAFFATIIPFAIFWL